MGLMTEAYITGVGAYLPGDPVGNEELAARFGDGGPRGVALRRRALAANGIRTRHYAVDGKGMTVMLNEELAAHAVSRALGDRVRGPSRRASGGGRRGLGAGQPLARRSTRSSRSRRHARYRLPALDALR